MDQVPIPPGGLGARLDALGVRRRDAIAAIVVVGALVLMGLLLLSRRAPAVIAPPSTTGAVPSEGAPTTPVGGGLYVHVAGMVRMPGLYQLPAGARVADAIDAAGGPRGNGDLDAVNLAQLLTDGLKIEIPRRGGTPAPTSTTPSSESAPVSINSADETALEVIPGIGPVKAAAIVQYRTENGAFSSIEGLLEVSGIGPATLDAIRPYVAL